MTSRLAWWSHIFKSHKYFVQQILFLWTLLIFENLGKKAAPAVAVFLTLTFNRSLFLCFEQLGTLVYEKCQ